MAKVVNTTQAANKTAETAAKTAQETGFLQDPVFLGVVAAALLLIPILLIFKKYSSAIKDKFKPDYQGKSLEERLNEKQVKPALEFGKGSKTSKKVDYGLTNLGKLERFYKTTEVTEESI